MEQNINYTQSDRDRSIRLESEVKHIDKAVKSMTDDTKDLVETSRNQAFTIAGILESMKDAKAFMHEVGQHNSRLTSLESRVDEVEDIDTRLSDIERKLDRVSFLGKVMWAVVTTPAVLAAVILGLQFMQSHGK
jgi:predicted  nucleic acid-binding Zn-ribbon protein